MAVSSDIANSAFQAGVHLIDKLIVTDIDRAAAKVKLVEMLAKGDLAQIGANSQEAQNKSIFVAGWRPAVGWTCVAAFVLNFLLFPVMASCAVYYSAFTGETVDMSGLPKLDMSEMMPVLLGMLGLGGFRTIEKLQSKA